MRLIAGIFLVILSLLCSVVTVVPGTAAEVMLPLIMVGCGVGGIALIGLELRALRRN